MSRKRTFEEIDKIDNVDQAKASTNIHGAVTSLSPIKKGRKSVFFNGTIADETSQIRLVGFDAFQLRKLQDYQQKKLPVQLINCEVKASRYGEGYDVMLKSSSQIRESPRKIDVQSLLIETEALNITLDTLQQKELFQKVTVSIKVYEVKDPITISDKSMQDVFIADKSSTARVALWEDNVGSMEQGRSYTLKNFVVRVFQSIKYLTMGGEGAELIPIKDIGTVALQSKAQDLDCEAVLHNVTIVGVLHLDTARVCLNCKGRVEPQTPPLGKCSRPDCQMMQRYDLCTKNTTGKLMLMYESEGQCKYTQVTAHGEQLQQIVGENNDLTPDLLLKSPRMESVTIFKNRKVLQKVHR